MFWYFANSRHHLTLNLKQVEVVMAQEISYSLGADTAMQRVVAEVQKIIVENKGRPETIIELRKVVEIAEEIRVRARLGTL